MEKWVLQPVPRGQPGPQKGQDLHGTEAPNDLQGLL